MGALKNIWNGLKFAFSATIGLPCACAATAFLGALYILAEATNIVEAKVKKNLLGQKEVLKSPFFQSFADGLKKTLKATWKDYGVYAHITLAKLALDKTARQDLFYPEDEVVSSATNPIKETTKQIEKPTEAIPPVPAAATIAKAAPPIQTATPLLPSQNLENKDLPIANLVPTQQSTNIAESTQNIIPQEPLVQPSAPPLPKDPPKNLDEDIILPSSSPKPIGATAPFVDTQNMSNNSQSIAA